jgi:(2R)-3-sulfolactate dehydrogenase (NADP+)
LRPTAADLEALVEAVFVRHKVDPEIARCVATALVRAEADGISSHGLARVPPYADQAINGKVNGFVRPTLVRPTPAVINVDAGTGFAFPAIDMGLDAAIEAVKTQGMVALGIAQSHHFGVAGHHVERLADQGLLALAFSNTPAAIAPWGGKTALFGTNPIAFACPRDGQAPLVIDLSMSTVARGKVVLAAKRGEAIPADWAFDVDGNPTTDSKAAFEGTMAPLGGVSAGAKGAALALMVELLCGALTGSNFGYQGSSFFEPTGAPPAVGHLIFVIDPMRFAGGATFNARAEALFAMILAEHGTRLPGDRRLRHRQDAASNGIQVDGALYAELQQRSGV